MTKHRNIDELELGVREADAREPETFAQFLKRAHALGFSEREIDRLRLTYGQAEMGQANEHRIGGEGD